MPHFDQHQAHVALLHFVRREEVGVTPIVHAEEIPLRTDWDGDSEGKENGPLPLRIVEGDVRGHFADRFGEGGVIRLEAGRGEDAVAGRSERDHWPAIGFRRGDPVGNGTNFVRTRVPLDAYLQALGDAPEEVDAVTRALGFRVDVAQGQIPIVNNAPRTEELAFAGSSCSRGDLSWPLLREGSVGERGKQQGERNSHGLKCTSDLV